MGKILSVERAALLRKKLREENRSVVFTNGCFDILHAGHVAYLFEARMLGDALFVGLNGDASTRRLKGEGRPVFPQDERAEILSAIEAVDCVVVFDEDTPLELIKALVPDVLVKGGDWKVEDIVGKDVVERAGGRVESLGYLQGRSTSGILKKLGKE